MTQFSKYPSVPSMGPNDLFLIDTYPIGSNSTSVITKSNAIKQTVFNILDYGGVADSKQVTDASITTGTSILTSGTANFTTLDLGKYILLIGAGNSGQPYYGKINTINSTTSVTLSKNAQTTVSGGVLTWGTDNGPAVLTTVNLAQPLAAKVYAPGGTYFFGTSVAKDTDNITIVGDGEGKTIFQNGIAFGGTMLNFGNAAGPSVRQNHTFDGFTIDMIGNYAWGLTSGWTRHVRFKNIRCINPGVAQFAMLFVGLFSNQNSSWPANDIVFENVWIDYAGGGPAWEAITLGFARDVTLINVSVQNKPSGPGILTYNSEQVNFVGGHILKANVQVSGRGPTNFSGTRFEESNLYISAADNVTVESSVSFIGTAADQGTNRVCGISINGNYFLNAQSGEVPFYITTFPYTWQCKNIVLAGTFQNCNASNITAGTTTVGSVTFLATHSLSISNISAQSSYWDGINVAALYLTINANRIYDSGQAPTGSVKQNYTVAAQVGVFIGNQSWDDQGTPTTTRDVVFNNGYATYIPTQAWRFGYNNLTLNSGTPYFSSSSGVISTTNPGNITLT